MAALTGQVARGDQDFARLPQTTSPPEPAGAPFIRNSRQHVELAFDTGAVALGTIFGPRDIPAIGYFRDLFLDITTAGGTLTSPGYTADGPFNAIASLQLLDITGATLVDVSSFDLVMMNIFGGYSELNKDPRAWPFALNLATAQTTGIFSLQVIIPAELLADAYGSLPNENAPASMKARFQFETAANIFTGTITTPPTIDVRADLDAWTRPISGAPVPPGLGSTAYWSKQIYGTVTGLNTIRLVRVGNWIHTLILIFRSSAQARYDISTITDFRLRIDGVDIIGPTTIKKVWTDIYRGMGFNAAVTGGQGGVATGLFMGVLPLSYRMDVGNASRGDSAELWLPTTGATRLEVVLTLPAGGSAGQLQVLTGEVIPEAGDVHRMAVS